jgi:serine/threonine protein kinase
MYEVLYIIPPITSIVIPGLDTFLNGKHDVNVILHTLYFSITEPVFSKVFNPDAVILTREYFNKTYNSRNFKLLPIDLVGDEHKLIGHGTYGCIYTGLSCTNVKVKDNEIAKLVDNKSAARETRITRLIPDKKQRHDTFPEITECQPEYVPHCPSNKINSTATLLIMPNYGDNLTTALKGIEKHKVFQLLQRVIDGIMTMNKRGLFHMDIKPENLVYDGSRIRIIDYGISLSTDNIPNEDVDVFETNYTYWPLEVKLLSLSGQLVLSNHINGPSSYSKFILESYDIKKPGWLNDIVLGMSDRRGWKKTVDYIESYPEDEREAVILLYADIWGFAVTLINLMRIYPELYNISIAHYCSLILIADINKRLPLKDVVKEYDRAAAQCY